MIIGVPREVKNNEKRVAITPPGVTVFTNAGHDVWVETCAGNGSGFNDGEYAEAGAKIVDTAEDAWSAEIVMKVKEPQPEEYAFLREDLILFTYLHLAAEPELTRQLAEKKVTAIAYETIQDQKGALPLLAPMSEIAGRMTVQIGAQLLENTKGGKGVLLSGVPGVQPANVVVIGGGAVGTNAAKIAHGFGSNVTILDVDTNRLRELDDLFSGNVTTLMSNPLHIRESVKHADLVVGAVLIPGAKAPTLVSESMVKDMKEGSVIIDVAIDQGGTIETADRITTHDEPTYQRHGVIHYAVPNIPGAVARTATMSLTNNTSQYGVFLANKGFEEAVKASDTFAKGVNTYAGAVTHPSVAKAHEMDFKPVTTMLDDKSVSIF